MSTSTELPESIKKEIERVVKNSWWKEGDSSFHKANADVYVVSENKNGRIIKGEINKDGYFFHVIFGGKFGPYKYKYDDCNIVIPADKMAEIRKWVEENYDQLCLRSELNI